MLDLRRATPSDADAFAVTVSDGFRAYREFAPAGWTAPDRIELALGIAMRLHDSWLRAWIAEDEHGEAAGHVTYLPAVRARAPCDEPGLAHLEQLFVRRTHWGSGAAARLLAVAVADAAAEGYATIRLYTPVDHGRARRFYEREGWATVGEPLRGEPIGLDLIQYRRSLAGSDSRVSA
jgi:GNAT superfamily N-acetyltransferase